VDRVGISREHHHALDRLVRDVRLEAVPAAQAGDDQPGQAALGHEGADARPAAVPLLQ
jgi:hypothetical protein